MVHLIRVGVGDWHWKGKHSVILLPRPSVANAHKAERALVGRVPSKTPSVSAGRQAKAARRGGGAEKRLDRERRIEGCLNSQGLVSSLVGGVGRPASIVWLGHCIALRPASFPVAWAQGVACNRGHWLGHIQARSVL